MARLSRGITTIYVGGASLLAVVLADLMGLGGVGIQAAQFGAALLIWTGCITMLTGVPHLVRFGTRRGALAFMSFAAAGASGLVAVAEMFESFFLESTVLSGLDELALALATVLLVVGGVLLKFSDEGDSETGSG